MTHPIIHLFGGLLAWLFVIVPIAGAAGAIACGLQELNDTRTAQRIARHMQRIEEHADHAL